MRCLKSIKTYGYICLLLGCSVHAGALAQSNSISGFIDVIHLNESQQNGQLLLDAQGDITLSAGLLEALEKGITLYFRTDIQVRQLKSGLMRWHQPSVTRINYLTELRYSRFYQRYTLVNQRNGNVQHFQDLQQALNTLTRLQSFALVAMNQLHPGLNYQIQLRFSVDYWQLNAPLLTHALFHREWRLTSDWHAMPIQLGRL